MTAYLIAFYFIPVVIILILLAIFDEVRPETKGDVILASFVVFTPVLNWVTIYFVLKDIIHTEAIQSWLDSPIRKKKDDS